MISAWLITLLRALFIAVIATGLANILAANIRYLKGRTKNTFLVILLLPLTIPPLLPAYAYSAFAFNFQTSAILNELLYILLMISRTLSISIIVLLILSPALSKSSIHCLNLLPGSKLFFIQTKSHLIIASLLTFIFTFNDYEIASLMRIKHWTVVLFNAHAGGLVMNIPGSFQMAVVPALTSLVAVIFIAFLLKNHTKQNDNPSQKPTAVSLTIVSICALIAYILPFLIVLLNSFNGFIDSLSGGWMRNEFINSISVSLISTVCCLTLVTGLLRCSRTFSALAVIPGLFGALLLGLLFIYLFNLSGLSALKQSLVPLSVSLIIYAIPVAFLMVLIYRRSQTFNHSTIDLLPYSSQTEIKWQTSYLPGIIISLPLFCYIWFDLTLSSMLAPASFTTLFPRIYNLMHYSENEKLSATVLLTAAIPFILFILTIFLSKTILKTISRSSR